MVLEIRYDCDSDKTQCKVQWVYKEVTTRTEYEVPQWCLSFGTNNPYKQYEAFVIEQLSKKFLLDVVCSELGLDYKITLTAPDKGDAVKVRVKGHPRKKLPHVEVLVELITFSELGGWEIEKASYWKLLPSGMRYTG